MGLKLTQTSLLHRLYYNTKSAAQFSGADRLYRAAHTLDPSIKYAQVEEYLRGQRSYTLHKKVVRRYPRLRTIPSGLHTDWQADLAHFLDFSNDNDDYSYLLVCVDVLSRKIFVEPLKTKRPSDMQHAFDVIFKQADVKPWKLFTDRGLEFEAKAMQEYFKKHDVIKYCAYTNPTTHAAIVERAIRTIKGRLYRFMSERGTSRWIDEIQAIINAINNSVNRSNGCAPNVVTFENAQKLWDRIYGKQDDLNNCRSSCFLNNCKFKIGDHVRIEKYKGHFEKGYYPNFTDEIFHIFDINTTRTPIVYRIADERDQPIRGWFYAQDLCRVTKNAETTYRIEKIIKTRKSKKKLVEMNIMLSGLVMIVHITVGYMKTI